MFPDGTRPQGRMEVVVVFPDQSEPVPPRDKEAGKRFVREWTGTDVLDLPAELIVEEAGAEEQPLAEEACSAPPS